MMFAYLRSWVAVWIFVAFCAVRRIPPVRLAAAAAPALESDDYADFKRKMRGGYFRVKHVMVLGPGWR